MTHIAIVGSGIIGAALAHVLTQQGHSVTIFEKGPDYPYPHSPQFQDQYLYLRDNPAYDLGADLKNYTSEGIGFNLNDERYMRVGGSATFWEGICIRMDPADFRTRTLFGYGRDWPITYDDLEAYYGQAEALLGVSGTDDDNPFAPPRSGPYPLPSFALSYDDQIMAARLQEQGIVLHSTPQARTRDVYDGRASCMNFGVCRHCPIGARYSPNHHLQRAVATGLCEIITGASVRRIALDERGRRAQAVIYRLNDEAQDREHACDVVIVAAGALESARLLLLSNESPAHAEGIGNSGGQVGAGLAFHSVWTGRLRYDENLFPGRFGGWTGQSLQFINAETRGQHAAVKVEFSSRKAYEPPATWRSMTNLTETLRPMLNWRPIVLQAESAPGPGKDIILSTQTDRFGDAYAHIRYHLDDFDAATYDFARGIFDRFTVATGAVQSEFPPLEWFTSGAHHMGGCAMSDDPGSGVVDPFGRVHMTDNLFVLGGSNFPGTSGAMNPTLTMVALALRSADYLLDQVV